MESFGFESYMSGLMLSAGLIIAIGSQNAFVLGQSLRREHHWSVAFFCLVCDALMMSAGVLGVAFFLEQHLSWLSIIRWGAVIFLGSYAFLAFKRALCSSEGLAAEQGQHRPLWAVLASTAAVTLLNPHVYLDTLVLVGIVGSRSDWPTLFILGAVSGSALWFLGLAGLGSWLAPWLARPWAWRCIDLTVAVVMASLAIQLGLDASWGSPGYP